MSAEVGSCVRPRLASGLQVPPRWPLGRFGATGLGRNVESVLFMIAKTGTISTAADQAWGLQAGAGRGGGGLVSPPRPSALQKSV